MAVEAVSVAVASMVVVVAVVSMGEDSVVGFMAAASALAERASQVAFGTLLAQDPAFLHLGVHHIDNLSILDDLADP